MINVRSIISFRASITEDILDFEQVPRLVEVMAGEYLRSHKSHSFSFRILLPRSKTSKAVNNQTKKLCLQIQSGFLTELKKLKLKPDIRELRYIHDDEHFGWLLIDPSIYETL
ncbi:MAG: hypothetical protein ACTHME_07600 [Candidatus Nitrosocosmicus sp.]